MGKEWLNLDCPSVRDKTWKPGITPAYTVYSFGEWAIRPGMMGCGSGDRPGEGYGAMIRLDGSNWGRCPVRVK